MPIVYRPVPQKVLIEEANEARKLEAIREQRKLKREAIAEADMQSLRESTLDTLKTHTSRRDKYAGFTERVRNLLMEHALSSLFEDVLAEVASRTGGSGYSPSIVHSMCYTFITENNGSSNLLNNMKGKGKGTYLLAETYNIINSTFKSILEYVDREDPNTYTISNDVMSTYKDSLHKHYEECELAENIANRVTAAITGFIERNADDKKSIVNALTATKEKIDSLKTDDESIKESYARIGKRYISDVRNKPKGLFSEMVFSMTESVMSHKDISKEFLTEDAHIDMDKIVDKVTMMYGFLETVNALRLVNVDEAYIQEVLDSIKE